MNNAHSRPAGTDPSAMDVMAEGGQAEASANSEQAGETKPTLEFLSRTLGREFSSLEEAEKSLANLNSLVGDRSIAELRSKAELASNFEGLVQGYAAENGMAYEDARAELMSLAGSDGGSGSQASQHSQDDVAAIKQRLDRQDLLEAHPEAQSVYDDVIDLANARGLTLLEAYESSAAIQTAAKQLASSRDRNARGTVLPTSQRIPGVDPNQKVREAVQDYRNNRRSGEAADTLVATALGLR